MSSALQFMEWLSHWPDSFLRQKRYRMSACAKNAFGHWAKRTRPAADGENREAKLWSERHLLSLMQSLRIHRSRSPQTWSQSPPSLGSLCLVKWLSLGHRLTGHPAVEGVWKRLTGHGLPSLWIISLLWNSAKEMWVAKSTSCFSLQITSLMIRERKAESSSAALESSPPTPYTKSDHLGNF